MSQNAFIQSIHEKAARKHLRIAFPDAEDVRTLKAALILKNQKISTPFWSAAANIKDRRGKSSRPERNRNHRLNLRLEGHRQPALREAEGQGWTRRGGRGGGSTFTTPD
jgi:hypothetical protein